MDAATPLERAGAELRQAAQDAQLVALARDYPDWRIWRSSLGHWYATSRTVGGEENPGILTIGAGTLETLADLLADQKALFVPNAERTAPSRQPIDAAFPAEAHPLPENESQ